MLGLEVDNPARAPKTSHRRIHSLWIKLPGTLVLKRIRRHFLSYKSRSSTGRGKKTARVWMTIHKLSLSILFFRFSPNMPHWDSYALVRQREKRTTHAQSLYKLITMLVFFLNVPPHNSQVRLSRVSRLQWDPLSLPAILLDHMRQLDYVLAFFVLLAGLERVLLRQQKTDQLVSNREYRQNTGKKSETNIEHTFLYRSRM